jgi:hypothetical protein
MRALALLTPASAEELKGLGWAQLKEKLTWAQFAEAIGKFDILSVCACPVARHLPPCLPPSLPPRPSPSATATHAQSQHTRLAQLADSNDDDDLVLLEPPEGTNMEKLKEHSFLAFLVSNWVDAAKELFKQKSAANKAEAAAAAAAAEEAAEEAAAAAPADS